MKIAVLKERRDGEKRVAASPDSVAKFISLGCSVTIETGAGDAASILDGAFKEAGATIAKTPADTVKGADLVLKIARPLESEIKLFSKGQALACHAYALTEGNPVCNGTRAAHHPRTVHGYPVQPGKHVGL
jgi:H+-translocating NAD(P) transhydrogenase subunit alpha